MCLRLLTVTWAKAPLSREGAAVIPAKAGIQLTVTQRTPDWIPACAGMTRACAGMTT